jgi:hypothetical protein
MARSTESQMAMFSLPQAKDAEIAALKAALKDCADDLEAEVRATHGADHPDGIHPSQVWKFERDMEPVKRARALSGEGEG